MGQDWGVAARPQGRDLGWCPGLGVSSAPFLLGLETTRYVLSLGGEGSLSAGVCPWPSLSCRPWTLLAAADYGRAAGKATCSLGPWEGGEKPAHVAWGRESLSLSICGRGLPSVGMWLAS